MADSFYSLETLLRGLMWFDGPVAWTFVEHLSNEENQ